MSDTQPSLPLEGQSKPEEQLAPHSVPAYVADWDDYFMHLAQVVSIKSKDENCRVGAVIVSTDNIVLSTGFNGLARGVYDDKDVLADAKEKLKVICHAEQNAIMNAARVGGHPLHGATIYVTKFPCLACCNAIIQAGIKRVYTHDTEYWKKDPFDTEQTRKPRVLHEARIKVDAPFHPDFSPKEPIVVPGPRKKPLVRKIDSPALAEAG
jgi:dCMP deaminase